MKRLVILIVLLLCAVAVGAQTEQTYPPYFEGFKIPTGTYLTTTRPAAIAFNPWSSPDPLSSQLYYETAVFASETELTVEITATCHNLVGCQLPAPFNCELTGSFAWREDWGSYVQEYAWPDNPLKRFYRAWTWTPAMPPYQQQIVFNQGCLQGTGHCCPWWEISEECVMYTWVSTEDSHLYQPVPNMERE